MTKETKLKRYLKEYLQKSGWFVFHVMQRKWSHKGISDYIAVKKGHVVFIEVKTEDGKQSKDQIEFEKQVKEKGGNYIIIRSIDDMRDYERRCKNKCI